jgi:hypothetical protein
VRRMNEYSKLLALYPPHQILQRNPHPYLPPVARIGDRKKTAGSCCRRP